MTDTSEGHLRRAWQLRALLVLAFLASCTPTSSTPDSSRSPSPAPDTSASTSPVRGANQPPDCLIRGVRQDRTTAVLPAPTSSHEIVEVGIQVTVSGIGMPPGDGVLIMAFYGDEEDCSIPGDGVADHLFAIVSSDEKGNYSATRRWLSEFVPTGGRELPPGGIDLPYGRYFLLAYPCPSRDRYCVNGFASGSDIGGPIRYFRS